MTETIRTKADLLDIFADLNPAVITKQNMRDFIVSNLVFQSQNATAPAVMLAQSDVFVALPGCNLVTLPLTADYGDRSAILVNTSGAALTVAAPGGETIDSVASIAVDDEHFALLSAPLPANWITLINTTPDPTPAPVDDYALAQIQASGATTSIISNTYVDINDSLVDVATSTDMLIGPNQVTYVGTTAKLFAVDVSIFIGANGDQYTTAIVVNGTPISSMQQNLMNAKSGSCSLFAVVLLTTNNTVKVQVRGDGTSNDVDIPDMHLRLTEIRS